MRLHHRLGYDGNHVHPSAIQRMTQLPVDSYKLSAASALPQHVQQEATMPLANFTADCSYMVSSWLDM
jgi:hypothetical protein